MVSKGRFKEANETFRAIAKFNKVKDEKTYIKSTSLSICSKLDNLDEVGRREEKKESTQETNRVKKERTYSIIDVLRRPKMRRNTLITYYLFLVNSLVYYGMALNSTNLYGNKYLNTFLACLVDLPSGIIIIYLIQRFNRRTLLVVFLSSAAMCLFITAFTPLMTENGTNLYPFILTFACMGKFAICSSFAVIWLYGSEIFPTELRY
ncbi:organic cation transporter protein-like [Anneissia japonica]|uniref:organic cation transporter protein-like n=1 Tax=Anneissia japonica TaxID=1529436 RepID=UPI0014254E80|nr:organic cation transporter protein-like [Anneissia japonica]